MPRFQTVIKSARFVYSPYTATEMQGFAQVLAALQRCSYPRLLMRKPCRRRRRRVIRNDQSPRATHPGFGTLAFAGAVTLGWPP
jgi:hypothetical protein